MTVKRMEYADRKAAKGSDFLFFALYAFAGFAFELLLANLIEPALGMNVNSLTEVQSIIHWLITGVVWSIIGLLLISAAREKYAFDILETRCRLKPWQILSAALGIAVMAAAQFMDWKGFKPYLEFMDRGAVEFIFLYLYYLAETFLFSLIIIFGQKACELWFRKTNIPYGGIVLGLTWGLAHIFSKGSLSVGLLSAAGGFLMGASWLIVGRDYRKALPLLYIMFVI